MIMFNKNTVLKKIRKAPAIFMSFFDLVSVLLSWRHEHLDF